MMESFVRITLSPSIFKIWFLSPFFTSYGQITIPPSWYPMKRVNSWSVRQYRYRSQNPKVKSPMTTGSSARPQIISSCWMLFKESSSARMGLWFKSIGGLCLANRIWILRCEMWPQLSVRHRDPSDCALAATIKAPNSFLPSQQPLPDPSLINHVTPVTIQRRFVVFARRVLFVTYKAVLGSSQLPVLPAPEKPRNSRENPA